MNFIYLLNQSRDWLFQYTKVDQNIYPPCKFKMKGLQSGLDWFEPDESERSERSPVELKSNFDISLCFFSISFRYDSAWSRRSSRWHFVIRPNFTAEKSELVRNRQSWSESVRIGKLTISTHANSDAFLMAAILTPVATSFVNNTVATFCTSIIDFVDLWSAKESLKYFLKTIIVGWIRSARVIYLASFTSNSSIVNSGAPIAAHFAWDEHNLC